MSLLTYEQVHPWAKALKSNDPTTLLNLAEVYSGNSGVKDLQKALDNYEAYQKAGGSTDVAALIEEIKKELAAKK